LDVHRIPANSKQPSHLHFDFRYLFFSEVILLQASSDAAQVRWFSISELENLNLDAGLQRMLNKCLSKGLVNP
jgi:hypothetical protein